jgi:hypothetical protein
MICHQLKLAFIHIPRTSGSYLCNQIYNIFYANKLSSSEFWEEVTFIKGKDAKHWTLNQLVQVDSKIKNYFKFSIIRNPWDHLVSIYHIPYIWASFVDFSSWLNCYVNEIKDTHNYCFFTETPDEIFLKKYNLTDYIAPLRCYDWLIGEEDVHIIKYDQIQDQLGSLCDYLNVDIDSLYNTFPYTKDLSSRSEAGLSWSSEVLGQKNILDSKKELIESNTPISIKNYRDYYNVETKNLVSKYYREEINRFNWKY